MTQTHQQPHGDKLALQSGCSPFVIVVCGKDSESFADKLCVGLLSAKIDVFCRKFVRWGDVVVDKLEEAIAKSTHGIAIFSPGDICLGRDEESLGWNGAVFRALRERAVLTSSREFVLLPLCVGGVASEEVKQLMPMIIGEPMSLPEEDSDEMNVQRVVNKVKARILGLDPSLPGTPRTPRTPETPGTPGALPAKPPRLLGRQDEESKVLAGLRESYDLCCVHGPPGVGKSSVVIAACHRARDDDLGDEKKRERRTIVYVDLRRESSLSQIESKMLTAIDLSYGKVLPPSSPLQTERETLIFKLRELKNLCLILDNVDSALRDRSEFERLLNDMMSGALPEFTLVITSCYDLSRDYGSECKVQSVPVKPLDSVLACELLKFGCGSSPCSLSDADLLLINERVCEGMPAFLWEVGKLFKDAQRPAAEQIKSLLEEPLKFLQRRFSDRLAAERHFRHVMAGLPKDDQLCIHALSLFEDGCTDKWGARVLGRTLSQFNIDVDRLRDYSLVKADISKDKTHIRLLKIFSEYLRSWAPPSDEEGLSIAGQLSISTKRYCIIWLEQLIVIQNLFDRNSGEALRRVAAIVKDVKRVFALADQDVIKSNKLCFKIAATSKSFLHVCLTPNERVSFYQSCYTAALEMKYPIGAARYCLFFIDALLDSGELNRAQDLFLSLAEVAKTEDGDRVGFESRLLRLQYKMVQAKIDIDKNDSKKAVDNLKTLLIINEGDEGAREEDREFIHIHRILADGYGDLEDYRTAVSHLLSALSCCYNRYNRFEENVTCPTTAHPDTYAVLFRLGLCLFFQENYYESLQYLSYALAMASELQCDHITLAATMYQFGICFLAVSGSLTCPEARSYLEKVVELLEDDSSYRLTPIWLLAKQTLAKLLVIQGHVLIKDGKKDQGLAILKKADEYFVALLDDSAVASLPEVDINDRYRAATTEKTFLPEQSPLPLYSAMGLGGLGPGWKNRSDVSQSMQSSPDFRDLFDSDDHDYQPFSDTSTTEGRVCYETTAVFDHRSSELLENVAPSSVSSLVRPVLLRLPERSSSKTALGMQCCPTNPPQSLSGCRSNFLV